MKEKGFTQKALADAIGCSTGTVGHWFTRKANPPADKISEIANFMGVSIEWLLTGNESPNSNVFNAPFSGIGSMQGANHGTMNFGDGKTHALSAEAIEPVRIVETLSPKSRHKLYVAANFPLVRIGMSMKDESRCDEEFVQKSNGIF